MTVKVDIQTLNKLEEEISEINESLGKLKEDIMEKDNTIYHLRKENKLLSVGRTTSVETADGYSGGFFYRKEVCSHCGTPIGSDWKCCPMCERRVVRKSDLSWEEV